MAPLTHILSLPPLSLALPPSPSVCLRCAGKRDHFHPIFHETLTFLSLYLFLFSLFIFSSFSGVCFSFPITLAASQNSRLCLCVTACLCPVLSAIVHTICSRHRGLLYPSASIWAPAQILQMLPHAGFGPNQQGDKSIQPENDVTGRHIDQPSAPAVGPFLLCPLLNSFNSLCCASHRLPFGHISK